MELVKGFAKIAEENAEEKYIEGYLSNPANFNGVLFVLKEPNNGGVQSRFWFKECFENYYNESSNAKRQFTKYKRTFEKLLTYVGKDLKVENCAYANVLSFTGGSRESINYQSLSYEEKTERLDSLIETCNPRCVFVCTDMFDCICCADCKTETGVKGVKYENCEMRKTTYKNTDIFEIRHPARGKYPNEKKQLFR